MGLADQAGHPKLLQIHHRQHRGRQVVPDGHHGAVEIPCAQSAQHLLVLAVAHHGVGHIGRQLLHQLRTNVHGQHLRAQLAQAFCQAGAKAPQADYHIGSHKLTS